MNENLEGSCIPNSNRPSLFTFWIYICSEYVHRYLMWLILQFPEVPADVAAVKAM
jgi:hypothetical protein